MTAQKRNPRVMERRWHLRCVRKGPAANTAYRWLPAWPGQAGTLVYHLQEVYAIELWPVSTFNALCAVSFNPYKQQQPSCHGAHPSVGLAEQRPGTVLLCRGQAPRPGVRCSGAGTARWAQGLPPGGFSPLSRAGRAPDPARPGPPAPCRALKVPGTAQAGPGRHWPPDPARSEPLLCR